MIVGQIKVTDFNASINGIVDGSASKLALIQDTGYMVEKTYHDIAPYLGAFGPIYCLSDPYMVQKVISYIKTIVGTWRSSVKKNIGFGQKRPLKTI